MLKTILCLVTLLNCGLTSACVYYFFQKQKENETLKANLIRNAQDMRAMCRAAVGMGERLATLEVASHRAQNQPRSANRNALESNHYNQARKLFELGASLEDVMQSCRLTKEEAQLLALVSA